MVCVMNKSTEHSNLLTESIVHGNCNLDKGRGTEEIVVACSYVVHVIRL